MNRERFPIHPKEAPPTSNENLMRQARESIQQIDAHSPGLDTIPSISDSEIDDAFDSIKTIDTTPELIQKAHEQIDLAAVNARPIVPSGPTTSDSLPTQSFFSRIKKMWPFSKKETSVSTDTTISAQPETATARYARIHKDGIVTGEDIKAQLGTGSVPPIRRAEYYSQPLPSTLNRSGANINKEKYPDDVRKAA